MRRLLAAVAVVPIALGAWIWTFGARTVDQEEGDVAVVLGAAVRDSIPSPVFAARLDHAAALWSSGRVERLVLTGGTRHPGVPAESSVGREYLHARGVPDSVMAIEQQSRTTRQNLACAAPLVAPDAKVVLVSDPMHMWRARWQARDLGLDASASGTPSSRYTSWRTRVPFVAREVWFSVVYVFERWRPGACPG